MEDGWIIKQLFSTVSQVMYHAAVHIVEHVFFHRNRALSLLDPRTWDDYIQGACISVAL